MNLSSACLGVGSLAAVAVQGGGAEKYQPVARDWVWLEGVPVTADGGLCFRLPTHLFGWAQVLPFKPLGLVCSYIAAGCLVWLHLL
jgi:hypothetical protein